MTTYGYVQFAMLSRPCPICLPVLCLSLHTLLGKGRHLSRNMDIAAPNQQNANADRINAAAHGYSNTWEQFHSARVQEIAAGRHTIRVEKRSHNDGITGLAGFGMQGFWMRKDAGVQTAKCRATPSSWYYSGSAPMCTLPFTTSVPSIVAASFGGHGRSNHVYVAVSYDGDNPNESVPGRINTLNLLTHSCKFK